MQLRGGGLLVGTGVRSCRGRRRMRFMHSSPRFFLFFFWTSLAPLPALRESSHGNTYSDHNACSLVDGSQPSEFQRWEGLMMPLDLRCWERQNFQQFILEALSTLLTICQWLFVSSNAYILFRRCANAGKVSLPPRNTRAFITSRHQWWPLLFP